MHRAASPGDIPDPPPDARAASPGKPTRRPIAGPDPPMLELHHRGHLTRRPPPSNRTTPGVRFASTMEQLPSAEPAIRASGLVKEFGPVRAVDDVSFELAPGRIYGLLGPNGSGKTTLIRLLTGLTRATSGTAEVLGVTMPSRPNLSRIGYMTQADGVYTALTVRENARFFAATYGVRGDAAVDDDPPPGRAGRPGRLDRRDPVRRAAASPVARVRARPSAGRPLPRRADGRHRPAPPRPVLDALPRARRCGNDHRRVEPRDGRGRPLRRAPVRSVRARSSPAGPAARSGRDAGTDDLEQAFLRLGGDVAVTR